MKKALYLLSFAPQLLFGSIQDSILSQMESYRPEAEKCSREQLEALDELLCKVEFPLRVVTYNMLFNTRDDKLPQDYRWGQRLPRLVELIEHMQPDLIGTQELYQDQIEDLMACIGDTYSYVGAGRLDGIAKGEIEAILFRKDRFTLLDWQLYYASETPHVVSPEPTGTFNAFTVALLHDEFTAKDLLVINTHFSFGKADNRTYEAHCLADFVATVPSDTPVIVTGDFNTFTQRPDIDLPYHDGDWVESILTSGSLRDASSEAYVGKFGPISTTTFDGPTTPFAGTGTPGVCLDHIYVGGPLCVLRYGVEPARIDERFASDHLPVIADVAILNEEGISAG